MRWIPERSLTRWQVIAGIVYAAVTAPVGWLPPVADCRAGHAYGCWFHDHVLQVLISAGQGLIVNLVFLPPLLISYAAQTLHPALSLVAVPLYTIAVTIIVGHLAWLTWRWARVRRPAIKWLLAVVGCGIIAMYVISSLPEEREIVPAEVTLSFSTAITPTGRIPALRLSAWTQESCGYASRMRVKIIERTERVALSIDGFTFRTTPWTCGSNGGSSYAAVSLDGDWLKAGTGSLIIRVGGTENQFQLVRDGYLITVVPVRTPSARTMDPRFPGLERWVASGNPLSVCLCPLDVALLVKIPYGDEETDRQILERVAQQEGLARADAVYPRLLLDRPHALLVVVKGSAPRYKRLRGPSGEPYDQWKHSSQHIVLSPLADIPSEELVR